MIITGASSGIGQACAVLFARLGARVAIHYNSNEAGARETLALCDAASRKRGNVTEARPIHTLIRADLGESACVEDAAVSVIDDARHFFGRAPDSLILNAGIFENCSDGSATLSTFMSAWRRTMTVNVEALAALTYVFAKATEAAAAKNESVRDGNAITSRASIVTVGSRGALRGEPSAWAYGASKAAAHALSQNAALALGARGIVCAAVAPGFVATRMARFENDAVAAAVCAQSPWKRVATPEEVASSVEFAARFFENPWISGAVINCNGASYLSR